MNEKNIEDKFLKKFVDFLEKLYYFFVTTTPKELLFWGYTNLCMMLYNIIMIDWAFSSNHPIWGTICAIVIVWNSISCWLCFSDYKKWEENQKKKR